MRCRVRSDLVSRSVIGMILPPRPREQAPHKRSIYADPMDVGIQTIFASHGWDGISDAQVYAEDTELALLAEELGLDVVWAVEHHFYDYSFCPDNTEWLAYIAGRTERIDVGTAAVIMPWNAPLRVAEKVALLDQVANGRFRLGLGRGLSRREYGHFRAIEMDESRERFDEGSMMVKRAL